MVTCVVKGTLAAVKSPLVAPIVPPLLAVQVTVVRKLPVPDTLAVHWLVWPEVTAVGLQLAPTKVIVDVELLLPPPPQAAAKSRQPTAAKSPRSRTPAPLLDVSDIDALRHHRRYVSTPMEAAHVSALLEDEVRRLDKNRAVTMALLRGDGLLHRLKVRTQQLLQVGLKR